VTATATDTSAAAPTVGELRELARYTTATGTERVLGGQRVDGVVVVTDYSRSPVPLERQRQAAKDRSPGRRRSFAGLSTTRSRAVGSSDPITSGHRSCDHRHDGENSYSPGRERVLPAVAADRGVDGHRIRPVHGRRGRVPARVLVRERCASRAAARPGARPVRPVHRRTPSQLPRRPDRRVRAGSWPSTHHARTGPSTGWPTTYSASTS
jgi:hypothetical protein